MTKVISVGGSLLAPSDVDVEFVRGFLGVLERWLEASPQNRAVIVCGGGMLARRYQQAYREVRGRTPSAGIAAQAASEAQDWIGVAATRVNAELVRRLLDRWCSGPVVTDPSSPGPFHGQVLVCGGWKPGFSTDFDAVILAEQFGAEELVNLSNIAQVYTADPRTDPRARPLDRLSWKEFRAIVGDAWTPGKNTPFDPVAARRAEEARLRVIVASGADLANFERILRGEPFVGTVIGPD